VEAPILEKHWENGLENGPFSFRHPEWGSAARPFQAIFRNALFQMYLHQHGSKGISSARRTFSLRNFVLANSPKAGSRA
jgi:hypothetical protein